jgi:hypothetical protein
LQSICSFRPCMWEAERPCQHNIHTCMVGLTAMAASSSGLLPLLLRTLGSAPAASSCFTTAWSLHVNGEGGAEEQGTGTGKSRLPDTSANRHKLAAAGSTRQLVQQHTCPYIPHEPASVNTRVWYIRARVLQQQLVGAASNSRLAMHRTLRPCEVDTAMLQRYDNPPPACCPRPRAAGCA